MSRERNRDRRLPLGTRVKVVGIPHEHATVVRHGRDRNGVYTEVEWAGGGRERVHRSALIPVEQTGAVFTLPKFGHDHIR